MAALFGGVAAMLIGFITLGFWLDSFVVIIKGAIPILFILGGRPWPPISASRNGKTIKVPPPTRTNHPVRKRKKYKAEAEKYKAELEALKKSQEDSPNDQEETPPSE